MPLSVEACCTVHAHVTFQMAEPRKLSPFLYRLHVPLLEESASGPYERLGGEIQVKGTANAPRIVMHFAHTLCLYRLF